MSKDSHCSHCGTRFESVERYPRTCPNSECGAMTWANPIPVSVVLLPVVHQDREGLVVVRRAIPPQVGKLALVGGFVDVGETWQSAAAREVREEIGATIDGANLEPFWYTSTEPNPNRVLLFASASRIDSLPPFTANNEVSERGAVFGPKGLDQVFAFPLHVEAARRWFESKGVVNDHDYAEL